MRYSDKLRPLAALGWRRGETLWVRAGIVLGILGMAFSQQAPAWLWAKVAGESGGERAEAIAADAAGNVYVAGWFNSSALTFGSTTLPSKGSADFFVVKYNTAGIPIWARSGGGPGWDWARAIAVDGNGNVYVTGRFESDSLILGSDTLVRAGQQYDDIFVVKYDPNGNVLWARRAGGSDRDGSTGIATDGSGNVYVVGWFWSTSIAFGSITLTNAGGTIPVDLFVAKYDPNGNVLWARRAGGSGVDVANRVAADAGGNIWVTGRFRSSSISFGSTTLNNIGSDDIFVVKYDPGGNALWAKVAGGNGIDEAFGIAVDPGGNTYITGEHGSDVLAFSSTITLANTGNYDFFIAKYDPNGNVLWAKGATGTGREVAYGVAADASGNVCVAGRFESASLTFGPTTLTNQGNNDIFVVGYDENGNEQWAMSVGASGSDVATGIALEGGGNGYVAGAFESASVSFGANTLNGFGSTNAFVAKMGGLSSGMRGIARESGSVRVYPDASGSKRVMLELGPGWEGEVGIELYNSLGERVYVGQVSVAAAEAGGRWELNLTEMPAGVYVLHVHSREKATTLRLAVW